MIFVNWANFFFIFQIGEVLLLGTFLLSFGLKKKEKFKRVKLLKVGVRSIFELNKTDRSAPIMQASFLQLKPRLIYHT